MTSNAARQRKFRKSRRKEGWKRLDVWVRSDLFEKIKGFINKLHKEVL